MFIDDKMFDDMMHQSYMSAIKDVLKFIENDEYCVDQNCSLRNQHICDNEIWCLEDYLKGIVNE